MNLFQYVHLKVLVSNAECDAPQKLDQEVQTWNDPHLTETEVMGKREIPLEENMKRRETAGYLNPAEWMNGLGGFELEGKTEGSIPYENLPSAENPMVLVYC